MLTAVVILTGITEHMRAAAFLMEETGPVKVLPVSPLQA